MQLQTTSTVNSDQTFKQQPITAWPADDRPQSVHHERNHVKILKMTTIVTIINGLGFGLLGTLFLWGVYSTVNRCLFVPHTSMSLPWQWAAVLEDALESTWQQCWSWMTLVLVYDYKLMKDILPLSIIVAFLDVTYRILVQWLSPSFYGSSLRSIPLNVISVCVICVNALFAATKIGKAKSSEIGIGKRLKLTVYLLCPPILGVLVAYLFKYFLLPLYSGMSNDSNATFVIIALAPVPFFLGNIVARACVQRLAEFGSEYDSQQIFVLCTPMLNAGAFILRTIQAESSSLGTMAVVGLYFGAIEFAHRGTLKWRDRIIAKITGCGNTALSSNAARKQLYIDIIISGMLAESMSIVFSSGAQFAFAVTYLELDLGVHFIKFVERVAVQLSIEWAFDLLSVTMEAKRLPLVDNWNQKWKHYLLAVLLIFSVAGFQLLETFASFIQLTSGFPAPSCPYM